MSHRGDLKCDSEVSAAPRGTDCDLMSERDSGNPPGTGVDKLVVLWRRFGPYHLARLEGAAAVLEGVVGLEVAAADHYAWKPFASEGRSRRRTLFSGRVYESLKLREVQRAVRDALEQEDPRAVAINGWAVAEALEALAWCRRRQRRAILMSESFVPSGNPLKEWVKRRRVARFDAALVGGRWHRDYLIRLGFPAERIEIGYDVVDNGHFRRGAEAARGDAPRLRAALGLPEHYVFANARFLPRKNIDGLLRAFAGAARQMEQWQLVISGSGEMEAEWKQLARELGLQNQVRWVGFLQYDDLPTYYGLASCFVHPAHSEAWGLVVNEACAAGLPIIAGSRAGATCELVVDGVNGRLVDSGSERELAEALLEITRAGDRGRERMGRQSEKLVADLGPDRFGSALQNLMA